MTVKEFNVIQTMFEKEMNKNLIDRMREFISEESRCANKRIKMTKSKDGKAKLVESFSERIKGILDFMFRYDLLDIETYMSEYDHLIDWELKKIEDIYHQRRII